MPDMHTSILLITLLLTQVAPADQAVLELPTPERILAELRPARPRVLASQADFDRAGRLIRKDELAARWYAAVLNRGQRMLKDPPTAYEIPDGIRLLQQSRRTLDRAITLGLLYRIEGDTRYRDRIWQDLEAAARFKDWNPRHFLDVGEMTCAFAVAYDWLYDAWTDEQRATIRDALVRHGLETARKAYQAERKPWWVRSTNNWNQVCNGGIGIGAIAVADELPELAGEVLHHALRHLPRAVASFAPDGACVEGPGYWAYATRYYTYLLATLDSAFGRDFGLSELPAVDRLGDFPVLLRSPTNQTFNFADCSKRTPADASLLWLAQRFARPAWAQYQIKRSGGTPLDLLWYHPALMDSTSRRLPLDAHFRHIDAIVMRSAWNDQDAWYLGCKAGDNRFPHGNLDIGSFVLEAFGQRWAEDLGRDNYNLPGYWSSGRGGGRWTYYRMRAQGHNTLVIRPGKHDDQVPTAAGKVLEFASDPDRAVATIDMTPAYTDWATRAVRTFALDRQADVSVTVRDELDLKQPEDVYWLMHTRAKIDTDEQGRRARLSLKGKTLHAHLLSPDNAAFSVLDAAPLPGTPDPEKQAENKGVRRLAVKLEQVSASRIEIVFSASPEVPQTAIRAGSANAAEDHEGWLDRSAPIYEQTFAGSAGLDDYVFSDRNAWRVGAMAGNACLELATASGYEPPHRSPKGMAVLATPAVGSFVLEADLMQTGREYSHRDMCVFFGVRDAAHYYYAHIASQADDVSHQIHIVDGADRRPIATSRSAGVEWGQQRWHRVRVERDLGSGVVQVYFDDMENPVLTARDVTLTSGYVGFGSFDDVGRIDNVRLWADKPESRRFAGFGQSAGKTAHHP
jgi:hypothetical protein